MEYFTLYWMIFLHIIRERYWCSIQLCRFQSKISALAHISFCKCYEMFNYQQHRTAYSAMKDHIIYVMIKKMDFPHICDLKKNQTPIIKTESIKKIDHWKFLALVEMRTNNVLNSLNLLSRILHRKQHIKDIQPLRNRVIFHPSYGKLL